MRLGNKARDEWAKRAYDAAEAKYGMGKCWAVRNAPCFRRKLMSGQRVTLVPCFMVVEDSEVK